VRFFPGIITRNWQLKLSALAMAVLLWTVPEFETQRSQVLQNVPVRVQLNDPQWALRGNPVPASIQVSVSGATRDLMSLRADRPSIVVPIDEVSSPDTVIPLLHPWLRMSVGGEVVVEELAPSIVQLFFEPIGVNAATLLPRLPGALPDGLSLSRAPEVNPEAVQISGPASRVDSLTFLNLEPLDLSDVRSSGTFVLHVDTTDLTGMALSPQRASVTVFVEETATRELTEVPVTLPALASDPALQSRPSSVTLVLVGARSLVEAVVPSELRVTVSRTVATALAPGEEVRATLTVEGVPDLVDGSLDPGWVILRRPTGL
jgi:YbbR domain-containing protein